MILLTGHRGYIGTVMTEQLQAAGFVVKGIDAGYFEGCDFLSAPRNVDQDVRKDVRDITAADLEGVRAIIHLAGLSNDPLGELNAGLTEAINCQASVRLARLAKEVGVSRFLFASSCSMYGIAGEDRPLTEDDPLQPLTAYARSKVDTETAVRQLADNDFHPVFLRNATVYGVSPRLRLDLVVNNLTAAALTTGRVTVCSDGTPWRPLLHIEDFCRAFIAALQAPAAAIHNQAFNVGRDEDNHQVRDIARNVAHVVAGSRLEILNQTGPDERSYRVSFAKIQRCLPGFAPQWSLARGIEQLHAAFREAGITAADFSGPKYFRLRRINELMGQSQVDEALRCRDAACSGERN